MPKTRKSKCQLGIPTQRVMKSKGDDNTYSWILPVDIDAVEVMVLDEVGNVGGHCQPISRSDTVTENHVRARIGGKCPSTDRQDTRCAYDLFEQVELVGGTRRGAVGDLDLIRRGEGTKSEINVCVSTQRAWVSQALPLPSAGRCLYWSFLFGQEVGYPFELCLICSGMHANVP